jgi:hypothetical protein
MADTTSLSNSTPLIEQAEKHQAHHELITQMVSSHQIHDDAFFDATGASDFPEMGYFYSAWWASFKRHLEAHAVANQGMAICLRGVIGDFSTVDATPQS